MERNDLTKRESEMLLNVLRKYADSKKPVSSSTIFEMAINRLSPSTIRMILNDLEKKGYLRKEHISSGRVPTDKAYKFFAETALKGLSFLELKDSANKSDKEIGDIRFLARDFASKLSEKNRSISFATSPSFIEAKLKLCEFYPLIDGRIVLFLVSNNGRVFEKIIEPKQRYSFETLRVFSNYITHNFKGYSFREMRNQLNFQILKEREKLEEWVLNAFSLISPVLDEIPIDVDLFLSGIEWLVDIPELTQNSLKEILEAIEKKEKLLNLIDLIMKNGRESAIVLGEEIPAALKDCPVAIISVSYGSEMSGKGVIGLIGYKAMKYDETLLDLFSSALILTRASIYNSIVGGEKSV